MAYFLNFFSLSWDNNKWHDNHAEDLTLNRKHKDLTMLHEYKIVMYPFPLNTVIPSLIYFPLKRKDSSLATFRTCHACFKSCFPFNYFNQLSFYLRLTVFALFLYNVMTPSHAYLSVRLATYRTCYFKFFNAFFN